MLAKQVLSQLSYKPTEERLFILKHFPIFCRFLLIASGLNRVRTVHLFAHLCHWTVTVHIGSPIAGGISPARRRVCGRLGPGARTSASFSVVVGGRPGPSCATPRRGHHAFLVGAG